MSDVDEQHHCGENVAGYALGALDAAEAEAFARHLRTCTICRDELESFQQVVALLPMTAPAYRASPKLKRRVKRAIASEPRAGTVAGRRRLQLPSLPRPALAGGFALAAAVVVAVVLVLSSTGGPGTRVIRADVTGPGSASVRLSSGHAELIVHHFAAPPPGKIYEVWLVRGSRAPAPTSALFGVTADGNGDVDVPGSLKDVREVLVTPEPAGGSQVPTHEPVIAANLT